ncbi:hypothetical protein BpHYR1_011113 [Brachionus plicatilis]|uniref:Uncharacterized protein n=1 Tax=Brachionus plicatilis TaxID=10195 RepID=A0A3M7QCV5_BRAPC|nr:hypothetical protein BpHYR1_011113 [Brachionus plicatilis]
MSICPVWSISSHLIGQIFLHLISPTEFESGFKKTFWAFRALRTRGLSNLKEIFMIERVYFKYSDLREFVI